MPQITKVFVADAQTQAQADNWRACAAEFQCDVRFPLSEDPAEYLKSLGDAEILITQNVFISEETLLAAPNLKFIQKMGGRADNIDLVAAKKLGIPVSALSLPGSVAVAEHAMALVLACAKKVVIGHDLTVKGAYRDLEIEPKLTSQRSHGFQWMKIPNLEELSGMTMGIFGFGDIGNEIAKRAKAFDMNIIYHKRHPLSPDMEKELEVSYVSKEELFRKSDFLIMISPLTPETEKAAGAKELALMKPSAYFINCCRGGVVDEDALFDALKNHRIAGAGLDVFVYEPIPFDHPFLTLDNVTLTPHIAGGKGGAAVRQIREVLANVQKFAENKTVKGLI